jgi:ketosteroid isomerase-like protein
MDGGETASAGDRVEEVARANASFYEAFERRDLDAMSDLWEHQDHVTCTHPGWSALRGWGPVAASWAALFQGPPMQFILTDQRIVVEGTVAWVTVEENILGVDQSSTVSALNLFVHRGGAWHMVAHHGAGVAAHHPGRDG